MAEQFNLFRAADVQDQGVILRTALGFKNFGNGLFIQTVGTQTVDGFRGNGHQLAAANHFRSNDGGLCILSG